MSDMETRREKNWGAEEWRAPTLDDGDVLLFSECGRVVKAGTYGHGQDDIDYRSHYFRIVKYGGGAYLLVKHGGGEERVQLDYSASRVAQFFKPLDSSERYLLMHLFYNMHVKARREATEKTAADYRKAFAEGRLKKRKVRGSNNVKVWIDNAS